MSFLLLKKPHKKTPGNIVLLVAHTVRKQRFEATSYQNLLTKRLRKDFHFQNCFSPNLVAFTSESGTCKMKRCIQGDIQIHDGTYF